MQEGLGISYVDDSHIKIGDNVSICTGPRLHVKNTSEIENFRLSKDFIYDDKSKTYLLVGLVGSEDEPLYGLSYTI